MAYKTGLIFKYDPHDVGELTVGKTTCWQNDQIPVVLTEPNKLFKSEF